jgi:hypothetical protein
MSNTLSIRLLVFLSDNRKCKIRKRKWTGFTAAIVAFALCGDAAHAQQPTKLPRIVFLSVQSPSFLSARFDAFRQGLRDLGYVEGKTS